MYEPASLGMFQCRLQRIFCDFEVIMFFRKDPPQTEGRRHAHPGIKTSPAVIDQIASPLEAQTEAQKEQKLFRRRARGCHCIGAVLNQLSWNWRECWQPAGSHASHWVARVGQARRCEDSAWMSRRPSSWPKLSTIVERPGQPVALIPRKRGICCVRASALPSK